MDASGFLLLILGFLGVIVLATRDESKQPKHGVLCGIYCVSQAECPRHETNYRESVIGDSITGDKRMAEDGMWRNVQLLGFTVI